MTEPEPNQNSDVGRATEAPQSTFCASLRSKKFFMTDAMPTEPSHYLDGANHCWCRLTQQVIGPDGGSVYPDACVPGRSCYSSAFEA